MSAVIYLSECLCRQPQTCYLWVMLLENCMTCGEVTVLLGVGSLRAHVYGWDDEIL
jgi:hypothetical protein